MADRGRTTTAMKVVGYVRVSTEEQAEIGVTDCNGNGSGLQSTKIWDQIICIYPSLQDGIICN
jgi:hypothetical protein